MGWGARVSEFFFFFSKILFFLGGGGDGKGRGGEVGRGAGGLDFVNCFFKKKVLFSFGVGVGGLEEVIFFYRESKSIFFWGGRGVGCGRLE